MKLLNLKAEIKEILEELENMYEISELEEQVNNINKIRDYIINLQQENKQLKEQLLATQTNEETFRLEMEDITKILGLDEDTIFDDVKTYARSLKENKILRENAEHNDKVVDKVNWENMLLKKENQELKKQLEEINKFKFSYRKDETKIPPIIRKQKDVEIIKKLENQQKEFISYLENKIYSIEPKGTGINYYCEYDSEEDYISAMKEQSKLNTLKEILSKYKSIIGNDINVGSIGGKDE